jgi:hypothetical protein
MIRKGPIVTLAAGATLAVALMVLNLSANATGGAGDPYDPTAGGTTSAEAPPTTAPPTTAAAKPAAAQVTYAEHRRRDTLAIAVRTAGDRLSATERRRGVVTGRPRTVSYPQRCCRRQPLGAFGGGRARALIAAGKSWSLIWASSRSPQVCNGAAADDWRAVVGG